MPRVPPKSRKTAKEAPTPAPSGAEKGGTDSHPLAHETIDLGGKIYTVRGLHVMLDRDLAELYGVEIRIINRAVKRNLERFPDGFWFQMTHEEETRLRSQIGILDVRSDESPSLRFQFGALNASGRGRHRKYLPYAFTEQGVAMLSGVLRSPTAIRVSIRIMQAFVEMRRFLHANAGVFQRLDGIERRQIAHETETDRRFEQVFNALEGSNSLPKQGIFYEGQIHDAHVFISDLIRSAQKSLVLIDNFVDDSVLTLLGKREPNVTVTIYTRTITPALELDLKRHNAQYPYIEVREFKDAHDRFLILDGEALYHIGASLKDLGKKWFAFSRIEKGAVEVLKRLS